MSIESSKYIKDILIGNDDKLKKALFIFDNKNTNEQIALKFNLWARYFFAKYFTSNDCKAHREMDINNLKAWRGEISQFVNVAYRGFAKRQPLDADILTPSGFKKLGTLKLGDYVIGSDGKKTKIEFLSPIIDRPIYRLKTEDGRIAECDEEHLWTIRNMNTSHKIETIDVKEILKRGLYYNRIDKRYNRKFREYKFALETVKEVHLEKRELPIEPYLLGCLLGDGNFNRQYGSARITFHKDDESHYRNNFINYELGHTGFDKRNLNVGTFNIHKIGKIIVKLGLNVHGNNKFIPDDYLYGSIEQRKAILEGLMDTDGTIGGKKISGGGIPIFCSASEKLADGVVSLVRSLGGRANKTRHENNKSGYYLVSMMFLDYKPFRLKRKIDRCGLSNHTFSRIISIDLIGNKLGRCIKVLNPDGLYVTDDYLLTHNTARTKLFIAFCIANDQDRTKRFIRCLSADLDNAKQSVTDIYNMFVQPRVREFYPEIFEKTESKREETMQGFTTATGVKLLAKQIGVDQRGKIMEDAKSDLDWYDDIETKTTIRSPITTHKIAENMEEARTGLALGGSSIYTANYFSEAGNIHKLITKKSEDKIIQITPIEDKDGNPTWDRYSKDDIQKMRETDEDFEGERMCRPSASKDVYFNRERLEAQKVKKPIREVAGFKIYKEYNPLHRYAGAADVAGGVGLDSSTSVFIDFDTIPAQVVGTYHSNTILPEAFGDELYNEANQFGGCLLAVENNKYDQTILKARQLGSNLYTQLKSIIKIVADKPTAYGWNTNSLTKSKMLSDAREAIESGLVELNDEDLINDLKSFTTNDLIDNPPDIRLTTRHFDLVMAFCIAWQMRGHARPKKQPNIWKNQPEQKNPAI